MYISIFTLIMHMPKKHTYQISMPTFKVNLFINFVVERTEEKSDLILVSFFEH